MIPLTRLPGGPNMLVPGSPSRATKLQVAGPPHSTPVGARNPFGDPPGGIDGEFAPHTPITGVGFDPLTGIPLLIIPLSAVGPAGKTTNWRLPAPPLAPPGDVPVRHRLLRHHRHRNRTETPGSGEGRNNLKISVQNE